MPRPKTGKVGRVHRPCYGRLSPANDGITPYPGISFYRGWSQSQTAEWRRAHAKRPRLIVKLQRFGAINTLVRHDLNDPRLLPQGGWATSAPRGAIAPNRLGGLPAVFQTAARKPEPFQSRTHAAPIVQQLSLPRDETLVLSNVPTAGSRLSLSRGALCIAQSDRTPRPRRYGPQSAPSSAENCVVLEDYNHYKLLTCATTHIRRSQTANRWPQPYLGTI